MKTRTNHFLYLSKRNLLWHLLSFIVIMMNACSSEGDDIDSPNSDSGGTKDPSFPVAEAVDLGLPSGTKWASWNIGASSPEEFGGYYAWGETETKDSYYWNTYSHCDGRYDLLHDIGDNIAGTEYDVAHVKWGGSWKMPTKFQLAELHECCTKMWITQNGVNGLLFTGLNGATIFLPAAGGKEFELGGVGTYGMYWSSNPDKEKRYEEYAYIYEVEQNWPTYDCISYRCDGASVRAVITPELPGFNPQYPVADVVDLGLPSGTKWASWNVGASAPEEFGGYYAWGETEVKNKYDWGTYLHCDGTEESCHNIGQNIAGTNYDVAHVKWGGSWCMPSFDQFYELELLCSITSTIQNGVFGSLLIGPNGASIFLPYNGYRQDGGLEYRGWFPCYWSSSENHNATAMGFGGNIGDGSDYRYRGFSVRPVIKE